MNQPGQTSNPNKPVTKSKLKTHWLNYRRKRFWALLTVLLYTLAGFFLAPVIIEKQILSVLQQDLKRTASIEKVELNPFVLSLSIQGLDLTDKDEIKLASFEEFFANFQLSSIFNRAWTFDEIRLTGPYFLIERFDETDSRLKRLADDFAASFPTEDDKETAAEDADELPRLLIHGLLLEKGRADLKDNLPETVVETQLSPINISIQELNTLPDRNGTQSVTIQLPDNASLKWSGSLSLGPFESSGELVLNDLQLDPVIAYLKPLMPLESFAATLSSRLNYHVQVAADGKPKADITGLMLEIKNLEIHGLTPVTEIIDIPKMLLNGGTLNYPQQTLQFSELSIDSPHLISWIKEDGNLSLLDLVPENIGNTEPASGNQPAWQLGIGELKLTDGSIEFEDRSTQPVAKVGLQGLGVSLSEFSNQENASMPLKLETNLTQGGGLSVNGSLNLIPDVKLTGVVATQDIPLNIGQPYVSQFAHVQVNSGRINSNIDLNFAMGNNMTAAGSAEIQQFDVSNTLDNGKLLSWESLEIDQFNFNLNDQNLRLSELTFDQLFGIFIIDENKTTNVSSLLITADKPATAEETKPMGLSIGGILIKDSSMNFSDLSLPLPFATQIINLEGRITTIDSASDTPAKIALEGQVDEYGLARINGEMDVMDPIQLTDVTVEFRNLLMSDLSPYTVEFAGREIDQGKLDLDLGYSITKGMLDGSNSVVLSDLELGEKVDHPDAASLPLGLAVSLLKDADGVINLDLPVEGDINNPEFKIGGVIWQAFSGVITKIVSAPFRLLGNLIGIDSEDLGQFEFLAGRFDLTPPELEKVVQLQEALQKRPELIVEVSGVIDPDLDTIALKKNQLVETATARLGQEIDPSDDSSMMLDDEIRVLVETMFSERFPDVDKQLIKAQHSAAPDSDPEGKPVLDELAYATSLWEKMLDAEPVTQQGLEDLANARATAIRQAFLSTGEFDESRVVIAESKQVTSEDGEWVVLELSVAAK